MTLFLTEQSIVAMPLPLINAFWSDLTFSKSGEFVDRGYSKSVFVFAESKQMPTLSDTPSREVGGPRFVTSDDSWTGSEAKSDIASKIQN